MHARLEQEGNLPTSDLRTYGPYKYDAESRRNCWWEDRVLIVAPASCSSIARSNALLDLICSGLACSAAAQGTPDRSGGDMLLLDALHL